MPLDRSHLTELLLERIYYILWRENIIYKDQSLEGFKDILRPDIIIQLSVIENELWEKK